MESSGLNKVDRKLAIYSYQLTKDIKLQNMIDDYDGLIGRHSMQKMVLHKMSIKLVHFWQLYIYHEGWWIFMSLFE